MIPVSSNFRAASDGRPHVGGVAAAAVAVMWLALATVAALVAITYAAIGVPALDPFAFVTVACVVAAIAVVQAPGSPLVGFASILLGTVLAAVAAWSLVSRTGDDGSASGTLAIAIASWSVVPMSLVAWRLGRSASARSVPPRR